jgi:hypothetical protein
MSLPNMPPPLPGQTPPPIAGGPPPAPTQETPKIIIDKLQQKTGVFSKQAWQMLVTDARLIFIMQQKSHVDYMRQDPNLSLAENPANFDVPLDYLQGIEIYKGDFESNSPDTMVVKTLSDKMTFMINDAYRVGQNLKKILGSKVK